MNCHSQTHTPQTGNESSSKRKVALFAAVPEEVGTWADRVNFTGIGRENATKTILSFINRHKGEDYIIINMGTVGSHVFPVGTILSIDEVVSHGSFFNDFKMRPSQLPLPEKLKVPHATLFSSDSFVDPSVYTPEKLAAMKAAAQCFDMESSALISIADAEGIKYVSFKIVSDNLDVPFSVWQERVTSLAVQLDEFMGKVLEALGEVEYIK